MLRITRGSTFRHLATKAGHNRHSPSGAPAPEPAVSSFHEIETDVVKRSPRATHAAVHGVRVPRQRTIDEIAAPAHFFPSNYLKTVERDDGKSKLAKKTEYLAFHPGSERKAKKGLQSVDDTPDGFGTALQTAPRLTPAQSMAQVEQTFNRKLGIIVDGIDVEKKTLTRDGYTSTLVGMPPAPVGVSPTGGANSAPLVGQRPREQVDVANLKLDEEGIPAHFSPAEKEFVRERRRATRAKRFAAMLMMAFSVVGLFVSDYLTKVMPVENKVDAKDLAKALTAGDEVSTAAGSHTTSEGTASHNSIVNAELHRQEDAAIEKQLSYRKQRIDEISESASGGKSAGWSSYIPSIYIPYIWNSSSSSKTKAKEQDAETRIKSVLQYKDDDE